jgi:hypothetical protein
MYRGFLRWNGVGQMVCKYMCFRPFVLYGVMGVIRMCVVAANGRTWVCVYFLVKWGLSNFLSFIINVDVMRVYVVGGDGPVPSYFGRTVLVDVLR